MMLQGLYLHLCHHLDQTLLQMLAELLQEHVKVGPGALVRLQLQLKFMM